MSDTAAPINEQKLALVREAETRLNRPHNNIKDVTAMLVEGGFSQEEASGMVSSILHTIRARQTEREQQARKDMLIGGIILVIGIAVTVITHYNASGGGSYVVAWGAIIFGAIRFFSGMAKANG
ncbi:MAG TPA: hypothetical protein VHL57_11565 [Flavobacteriales bacterium]|jgi:hypothetical protein|nr:hypothetical protein [Flavobacteriales bacterium]